MCYHRAAILIKEYPMSHIRVLICRVDDPTSGCYLYSSWIIPGLNRLLVLNSVDRAQIGA